MPPLFDFGLSQEDPETELQLLNIQPGDKVLCIASGGEIPLSFLCRASGTFITAVDISITQLRMCRLKMQAAILLPSSLSGKFLGYSRAEKKTRRELYQEQVRKSLSPEDQAFWDEHEATVCNGVINCGRFERYIGKIRFAIQLIIGKQNLERLICCTSLSDQELVFDQFIARRKAVKYLFKIAFHPALYKKRGLQTQALIHAQQNTGEIFFSKFRDFCTATLASQNYFLQYFLTGQCMTYDALPDFLQDRFRPALTSGSNQITWKVASLQEQFAAEPPGTYHKLHLSNIGDWLSEDEFNHFLQLLSSRCTGKEKIVARYLQKNHFAKRNQHADRFDVTNPDLIRKDRFPFYTIQFLRSHG